MSEHQNTRRKFLQILGLSAGTTLVGSAALGSFINQAEIRKLNPVQQEFMVRYGKWMDEFAEVIKIQKSDPGNLENKKTLMLLTEKAEEMKPELTQHMKDETFSLVYHVSIERVKKEI